MKQKLWTEKGAKEQFSLISRIVYKLSNSSDFQFIQKQEILFSFHLFEVFGHNIDFFVVHTAFLLPKKVENVEMSSKYDKKRTFLPSWD